MQKIVPTLWFDTEAEEAANFYVSLFPDGRILETFYFTAAGPRPEGMVLTVAFEIGGQQYIALNGGPEFRFNESISLMINCEDQDEIDRLWAALTEGGEESQCGWLKDKYGVSWQVTPYALEEMQRDPDGEKVRRMMEALLTMTKLDLAALQAAFEGR